MTNLKMNPQRCACMTADGTQCTRRAWNLIPNILTGDGHTYTYGRDVHLCTQHKLMYWRRRLKNRAWRMQLIHGGWLGCYNEYGFGNIVTTEPCIDWETVRRLVVPRYWYLAEGMAGGQEETVVWEEAR